MEDEREANLKTSADSQWEYYLEYGKATVDSYLGNATTLTIPSKIDGAAVTEITENFRYSIREVTSLTLPNTISSLPDYECFEGLKNLEIITLSDKITEIPEYCFENCSNLKYIRNYGKVINIDEYAFGGCSSLKEFDFSNIRNIEEGAFVDCSSLSKVFWPSKLKYIPEVCFSGCSSLKSLVLKKGLEEIERGAFESCISLEKISFPSTLKK